ncbi:MAG TPA: efflux RND transporter periplasmic adaptor subunit [Kofleriaceae bacterium]|nr:efflux RND transporter periplasmic adaptor subunit [Kofleriaceae bacterium]
MREPTNAPGPAAPRDRSRLAWGIVGAAAAAVVASFALSSDEDAAARGGREARATPVAVVEVTRGPITERSRYPGELDADAADISSFYAGRLKAVRVRVGDTVEEGAVLAEIDPVDAREQIARAGAQAQAAAAEARRAEVELKAAEVELARMERLRDQVSASELDAQRARTGALRAAVASAEARGAEARAGLRLLQKRIVESSIRAPFAGRIAARYVDPGVIVGAGDRLVRLVALSPLRVRFEVPGVDVAGLEVGARLKVVLEAGGTGGAAARVTGVSGEVSRDRRVATLEALIEDPPASWLPGMYAEVVVDRRTIEDATVVPSNAVLSRMMPDGSIATGVLVARDEVAGWVPVSLLAREDERAAVQPDGAALEPGALVLVAGHVDLADGSPITITADSAEQDAPKPAAAP